MLIPETEFKRLFETAGFSVSRRLYEKFLIYARLLVETNEKMNLTAITDPREIAEKHFLDSVLPLRLFNIPKKASLVDVGTGAGFPGIPIKLMRPDIDLTLIDSLQKRVRFLDMLTHELGINAKTIHIRAEDAGKGEFKNSFDVATARAVSRLEKLVPWCLPLVKHGGVMIALKGGDCSEEILSASEQLKICGGTVENTVKYALPNGDGRTLVIIRKNLTKHTKQI